MADEIDLSNDRILHDTDCEVARIAEVAAKIPPGEPGDCDLCGEWSGRLVGGVCAPCRDRRVPHLALSKPKPDLYVGEPKKRMTFDVTVVRRYTFARDAWNGYGIETVHIITMIDRATGACLVSKSGAFYAEEGEELKIKATVKEHAEYRGQAQTVVQRIAVLED